MYLPSTPAIPPYHPDDLAPAPFNNYIFGFRNLTGMLEDDKYNQKGWAQHHAPLFWVDEYEDGLDNTFFVKVSNLGLQMRPDLFDAHTLHWHGFKNVIPFFDGEPSGSISIPAGRTFTYAYRPRDPGTYMYHCHVEDTEHVHMGMTGLVFVRPKQNGNTALYPSGKFAYNCGDGSTGYDREYSLFLSEVFAWAHWADSHVELPEWTDYRADFALLNGRVYPDTLERSTVVDPFVGGGNLPYTDVTTGDLPINPDRPELQYQPLSSLITCNAGERVLVRFANLGFTQQTMTFEGVRPRVIAKDATLLRGITGVDASYTTESVVLGAGESSDVIFTAPPHSGGPGPDRYLVFNRQFQRSNNQAPGGFGGQATEIHVYPSGQLAPQTIPHKDMALA